MKLFESTWRDGYTYYERYYDTLAGKSIKRRIDIPFEWYVPSSNGLYTSMMDDSVKLDKRQGRAKDARGQYGSLDPMYRNIRDNYWKHDVNGYNENPNVWYLDIETRSGVSYRNKFSCVVKYTKIENIKNGEVVNPDLVKSSSVSDLQTKFKNGGSKNFAVFDTLTSSWENLSYTKYMERNSGFPVPELANEEITLMQFFDKRMDVMFVLGLRDWVHENDYEFDFTVKYIKCKDEVHMLNTFLQLFKKLDPLIIYAWSGSGFDFPYIHNRLKRLNIDTNKLSNYGGVSLRENMYNGKMEFDLKTDGHFFLDMIPVYKKFTHTPKPNYSLDTIAEIELKQRKVQHDEYVAFDDFYIGNYVLPKNPTEEQKNSKIYKACKKGDVDLVKELSHSEFVYYGVVDTFLVKKLDEKRLFTQLLIAISKKMGTQISDSLGTVKIWSQFIANEAYLNKQIMPPKEDHEHPNVVGGYVRDVQRGKHSWIISTDVNSMYPLLGMVGFNMSPETFLQTYKIPPELRDILLVHYSDQDEEARLNLPTGVKTHVTELLKKHKLSLGINGAVFAQDKTGMIPDMVKTIYKTRKQEKKKQFEYETRKLLLKELLKESM